MPFFPPRHVLAAPAAVARLVRLGLDRAELEVQRVLLSRLRLGRQIARFTWMPWPQQPAGIYRHRVHLRTPAGEPRHLCFTVFDFGALAAVIMNADLNGEETPDGMYRTKQVLGEAQLLHKDLALALT